MKDLIMLGEGETQPDLSYLVTLQSLKSYYTSSGGGGMGALSETQANCVDEINKETHHWEVRGQDSLCGGECETQRKRRLFDKLVEITYAEDENAAIKRVAGDFTGMCKANLKVLDRCTAAYGTSDAKNRLRAMILEALKFLDDLANCTPPLPEKFHARALLTKYQDVEDRCTEVLGYEESKLKRGEGSKAAYTALLARIREEVAHECKSGGLEGFHLRAIAECEDRWARQNDRVDRSTEARRGSSASRARQAICQSNDLHVKYENRLAYLQQLYASPREVPWGILETHFVGLCRCVYQNQARTYLKVDQCTPEEIARVVDVCRDYEDRLLSDTGEGNRTAYHAPGLGEASGLIETRSDERCVVLPPVGVDEYCNLLERIETAHIVTVAAATAKRNAVEASVAGRMDKLNRVECQEMAEPREALCYETAVTQMQRWLQEHQSADYETYETMHAHYSSQLPQPITRKLDVVESEVVNARHAAAIESVRMLRQGVLRNIQKEQVALRVLDHYRDVLLAADGPQKGGVVVKVDQQIDALALRLGIPEQDRRPREGDGPLQNHVGVLEELVVKWRDTATLPPLQFAKSQGAMRAELQDCLDIFATRHVTPMTAAAASSGRPFTPPGRIGGGRPLSPCEDSTSTPNMALHPHNREIIQA